MLADWRSLKRLIDSGSSAYTNKKINITQNMMIITSHSKSQVFFFNGVFSVDHIVNSVVDNGSSFFRVFLKNSFRFFSILCKKYSLGGDFLVVISFLKHQFNLSLEDISEFLKSQFLASSNTSPMKNHKYSFSQIKNYFNLLRRVACKRNNS